MLGVKNLIAPFAAKIPNKQFNLISVETSRVRFDIVPNVSMILNSI